MHSLIKWVGSAAVLLGSCLSAAQATPTAALNRNFAQYVGIGPVGNDNINDDTTVYWIYEGRYSYLGQNVDSYFLIWDPQTTQSAFGTISFGDPIVAFWDDRAELIATAAYQNPGVTYDYSDVSVGLEATPDKANTAVGGDTITIARPGWQALDPGDHVRVFVAVPEPGSLALGALALLPLARAARRRRS